MKQYNLFSKKMCYVQTYCNLDFLVKEVKCKRLHFAKIHYKGCYREIIR